VQRFSAWREGVAHYVPAFVLLFACLYPACRGHHWAWIGVAVFLFYGVFSLFFFRDPERAISAEAGDVVSPADGTVVAVEDLAQTPHYNGPCRRISIFLSILSVHVNRAPFEGTVRDIRRREGGFLIATKPEASEKNVSNDVWIETPRGPMTVRQITGMIARRIVCKAKVGDTLARGERFGMIKFGSRTELYLPLSADVCVKVAEKVKGGTSVVARFT